MWLKVLGGARVGLLVYIFYLYRIGQYAAMLKVRFDERVEERTRLARDLHDTLLQTIQGSKLVADQAHSDAFDAGQMHHALGLISKWLGPGRARGKGGITFTAKLDGRYEQFGCGLS